MAKIEEQDILKLLRGEASPKKLKKLEAWAAEDVDNATDLELYQTIFDESEHLSSYTRVDANSEWDSFSKALHNSVTDNELLHYFDGLSSPTERKKVEEWRGFSSSNTEEFNSFNLLISESAKLSEYKTVDVEAEWKVFDQMIKGKADPPNLTAVSAAPVASKILDPKPTSQSSTYTAPTTPAPQTEAKEVQFQPLAVEEEKEERGIMRYLVPLAVAAGLFLVGTIGWQGMKPGGWWNNSEGAAYETFATAETPDYKILSDRSRVNLESQSSIKYFRDVNQTELRDVEIEGQGVFEVESIPEKPFVVTAPKTGIGVRVIGTKFKIEGGRDEFIEIVENISGSVRAYSLEDTSTYVIMTAGDRYGFDGYQFINLNDLEEEYNGQDYDILYVLDYLMKESDWKVISGSEIEFDADGMVNIDLSKSYDEILEDLSERAGFVYVPRDCEGCYEVLKFVVE